MLTNKINAISLLLLLLFSSCISLRKVEYFRDNKFNTDYTKRSLEERTIQAFDELYIKVSSLDELEYNFFRDQSELYRMGFNNEFSISLISYQVSDSGYINFPIIGKVYLLDLTLSEAIKKMKEELEGYFNQPSVIMKFVNKRIIVLGEVTNPGYHTYIKEQISIFEALSLAGDITIFGNKKKVTIIRENRDNTISTIKIDLTDSEIFNSENYYLQPNDIIYVKPLKSRQWNITSTTYGLILSSITTFLLVLNYITQN